MRAFPKPHEVDKIETKTPKEKLSHRVFLYALQNGICACGCGRKMSLALDLMSTCTLDHIMPNKAGCRKQDANWNLRALRFDCNAKKGSKRLKDCQCDVPNRGLPVVSELCSACGKRV